MSKGYHMTSDDAPSLLIFVHLAKTAGSTFNTILRHNYSPWQDRVLPFRGSPFLGHVCPFQHIRVERRHYPNQVGYQRMAGAIEQFLKTFSEEQRAKMQVVAGHVGHGLHQHFPQQAQYVTFLRDPVARVISQIRHNRRGSGYQVDASEVARRTRSMEAILTEGSNLGFDNAQVRYLASENGLIHPAPYGECTPAMLEQAKVNIDKHFAFVGLTERFDASLLLFQKKWRLPHPYYVKKNVNKSHLAERVEDVPGSMIELVAAQNQYDIALYEYVQQCLDAEITALGEAFEEELTQFTQLNGEYQKKWRPLQYLSDFSRGQFKKMYRVKGHNA